MTPLRRPLPTATATNSDSHATHAGTLQIPTSKGALLSLPAVYNPNIRKNLLSVHHITRQWGQVIFSPQKAFIINTKYPNFPPLIGTATFSNGLYQLDPHHKSVCHKPHTFAARSFPQRQSSTPKPSPPAKKKKVAFPEHLYGQINTKRQTGTPLGITLPLKQSLPPSIQNMHNPADPLPLGQTSPSEQEHHHYHLLLNHIRPETISKMASKDMLPLLPELLKHRPPKFTCSGCVVGKRRFKPFHPKTHHYLIAVAMSSDICGPISPVSWQGNRYFLTLIDTTSRYLIVDFLPNRQQLSSRIDNILSKIKSSHNKTPHLLTTDNAKEYLSRDSAAVYNTHGIHHSTSLPYTPQQNGIAERINSTLVSAARAALHHSRLPPHHWEDAVRDAAFKYNCTMHNTTKQLPFTLWFGQPPRMTKLFIFGQLGTIPHFGDRNTLPKLHTRSHAARYLYPIDETTIVTLNQSTNKTQRVRAVDFQPYYRNKDPTATTSAAFKAFSYHAVPQTISLSTPPPMNHSQARRYPDAEQWATAHNHELELIDKNNVIRWIPDSEVPKDAKPIPLQVTYRYKRNQDGTINQRKARCVLRGDKMLPHIHYDPDKITTYMADRTSIRLLFAISAAYSLSVEHFDIEAAYLHEKFAHPNPVYVKQHPLFNGSFKHTHKTGILIGNLYGGKQAAHIYLTQASKFLSSLGFIQSQADPCIFHRITAQGFTFLAVSMDDFLVTASSKQQIDTLFSELRRKYKVKQLGAPSNYLGWNVRRLDNGAFHISQPATIEAILQKNGLDKANGTKTPYLDNASLYPPTEFEKQHPIRTHDYQKIIGELRYLSDSTRPDIFFVVNRLSTATSYPTKRHWAALKRLLRYLRSTTNYGIFFPPHSNSTALQTFVISSAQSATRLNEDFNKLHSYSDADYAADPTDRKSISGIIHLFNGAPIHWSSNKQTLHALSTCEAEYVAATSAAQQTIWLRRLLADIRMLPSLPTTLHIDNQSAIKVAKNSGPTKRRKYIDLRHHFLHGHIANKRLRIKHVASRNMLADILTKPLRPQQFNILTSKLNVLNQATIA